jgi:hypothetical protein
MGMKRPNHGDTESQRAINREEIKDTYAQAAVPGGDYEVISARRWEHYLKVQLDG